MLTLKGYWALVLIGVGLVSAIRAEWLLATACALQIALLWVAASPGDRS